MYCSSLGPGASFGDTCENYLKIALKDDSLCSSIQVLKLSSYSNQKCCQTFTFIYMKLVGCLLKAKEKQVEAKSFLMGGTCNELCGTSLKYVVFSY